MTDIVIIGGSVAGITAAIYAKRAGHNVKILEEKAFGGQIASTSKIENYPGFVSIDGVELSRKLKEQADSLGIESIYASALSIEKERNAESTAFTVKTDNEDINCKSVIIANGVKRRELKINGEDKFRGRGVSWCAVCDGAFFKNKTVAVIGGGNSALADAIYMSSICKRVYLIFRRSAPTASNSYLEKLMELENVKLVPNTRVTEFIGDKLIEKIEIENVNSGEKSTLEVNGVFEAIGLIPDNKRFENVVSLNENGYILTDESCKTSTDGIFAAGDTREKKLRQIVTAAADGAIAGTSAAEFLD